MRLSSLQPGVFFGVMRTVAVSVELTYDPEIDDGIEDFLKRQRAVTSVSRVCPEDHAIFVIALDPEQVGQADTASTVASYLETHFLSYGMHIKVFAADE